MFELEVMAWLIVLVEIQLGLAVLLFWLFRAGDGFMHLRLAGVTVTVYTGTGRGQRDLHRRLVRPVPRALGG